MLWTLERRGTLRFSELRAQIPGVTAKVLTERLRQLERDGLVTRTQFNEMPPRVEYASTPLTASLKPILVILEEWSVAHLDDISTSRDRFDAAHRDQDAGVDRTSRSGAATA